MTTDAYQAKAVLRAARNICPGALTIVGGHHPTLCPGGVRRRLHRRHRPGRGRAHAARAHGPLGGAEAERRPHVRRREGHALARRDRRPPGQREARADGEPRRASGAEPEPHREVPGPVLLHGHPPDGVDLHEPRLLVRLQLLRDLGVLRAAHALSVRAEDRRPDGGLRRAVHLRPRRQLPHQQAARDRALRGAREARREEVLAHAGAHRLRCRSSRADEAAREERPRDGALGLRVERRRQPRRAPQEVVMAEEPDAPTR